MTDEHDVMRGEQAREVLENPVYLDAYGQVEQELYRQWRESRNQHDREQLHQFLMMLSKVKTAMEATMRSGQIAKDKLLQKQSMIGRLRNYG